MRLKLTAKLRDFETRDDYMQARQVCALANLALAHGATVEEVRELLVREPGGFVSWESLLGGLNVRG